jgi:hypothetical protein
MYPHPTYRPPRVAQPRNTFALVSFLCGLAYVVCAVVYLGVTLLSLAISNSVEATVQSGGKIGNLLYVSTLLHLLSSLLGVVVLPCLVLALVMGHLALGWAKRHPLAPARRGLAVTGLVIGYSSVALTVIALVALIVRFTTLGHLLTPAQSGKRSRSRSTERRVLVAASMRPATPGSRIPLPPRRGPRQGWRGVEWRRGTQRGATRRARS